MLFQINEKKGLRLELSLGRTASLLQMEPQEVVQARYQEFLLASVLL